MSMSADSPSGSPEQLGTLPVDRGITVESTLKPVVPPAETGADIEDDWQLPPPPADSIAVQKVLEDGVQPAIPFAYFGGDTLAANTVLPARTAPDTAPAPASYAGAEEDKTPLWAIPVKGPSAVVRGHTNPELRERLYSGTLANHFGVSSEQAASLLADPDALSAARPEVQDLIAKLRDTREQIDFDARVNGPEGYVFEPEPAQEEPEQQAAEADTPELFAPLAEPQTSKEQRGPKHRAPSRTARTLGRIAQWGRDTKERLQRVNKRRVAGYVGTTAVVGALMAGPTVVVMNQSSHLVEPLGPGARPIATAPESDAPKATIITPERPETAKPSRTDAPRSTYNHIVDVPSFSTAMPAEAEASTDNPSDAPHYYPGTPLSVAEQAVRSLDLGHAPTAVDFEAAAKAIMADYRKDVHPGALQPGRFALRLVYRGGHFAADARPVPAKA